MKLRTTIAALLALATLTTAQDNLLTTAQAWFPTCDNYGSTLDTTGGLFQKDGSIKTTFTIAKKLSDDNWPYIELVCETPKPLTGTDSITVEYTCDSPLIIKLYQTDLGTEGNQSYALYQYVLPASKAFATKTIAISAFAQPDWADAESRAIALNLAHSQAIYFVPELSVETGGTASVAVKTLKLKSKKK